MAKKVDFDKFTSNYNELLREKTEFFSADENYFAQYKIELVAERLNRPSFRILEFGCGIGRNIPFMHQAFPDAEITGTDVSLESLEIASVENPNATFIEERGQPGLGPFDLIFVAGVFHHIPPVQREAALRSLAERLGPDGDIFIFEHNPFNPVTRKIVNNCPYDEDAILLRPSELMGLANLASLATAERGYCLFIPPKLHRLHWLEPKLSRIPLGGQFWIRLRHP